jgi:phage shock protein E
MDFKAQAMNIIMIRNIAFLLLAMCMSQFSKAEKAETVWIDVRSFIEHTIDNIEGDIRISYDEIVPQVSEILPDKNTEIYLYCGSGGRARLAMSALKEAGYTNVSNHGGIDAVMGLDCVQTGDFDGFVSKPFNLPLT